MEHSRPVRPVLNGGLPDLIWGVENNAPNSIGESFLESINRNETQRKIQTLAEKINEQNELETKSKMQNWTRDLGGQKPIDCLYLKTRHAGQNLITDLLLLSNNEI